MGTARKEARFVLAGAVLIAAVVTALLHRQHPSLAFSYRDGVDAIGMLNYIGKAGFSFSIPFVNLEMLGGWGPQDPWLSPSLWPAVLFGTRQSILDSCYVLCGTELFLSTYLLARCLGSPKGCAALGGLVLALFALPLVWPTGPFNNLLTFSTAFGDFIVLNNVLLAGLARIFSDRASFWSYALLAVGALWLVLVVPLAAILAIPLDIAVYAVVSARAAGANRFWTRQILVWALIAILVALLGPYLFGLFANTSSSLFAAELTGDTFTNPWPYLPALFRSLSNVVATIAIALFFYAAHYWHGRSTGKFSATLFWILAAFAAFAFLHSALFVLAAKGNATFPRPSYFEVAAWPFYALAIGFIGTAFWQWVFSAPSLAPHRNLASYSILIAFAIFALLMGILAPQRYETAVMPDRPTADPITRFLLSHLGLPDGRYAGQVATFTGKADNVGDVLAYDRQVERRVGNPHRGETLRFFGLRTLDEDSAMISPSKYLLLTRFLSRPEDKQSRAMVVFTKPAQSPLAALGVRYVVSDYPLPPPAIQRFTQPVPTVGAHLVYELQNVNAGNYAPTTVRVAASPEEQLRAVLEPDFDFRRQVITGTAMPTLVPAESRIFAEPGGYRIAATSAGPSLLVLPIAYSNCLRWKNDGAEAPPRLIRVDFALTGLLFNRRAAGRIVPAQSPFLDPLCGIADWLAMRSLKFHYHDIWPAEARASSRAPTAAARAI